MDSGASSSNLHVQLTSFFPFQYKRQSNIADPKGIPSSSDSMETSGDSMPPSNPSIAPDPMEEASAEIGAGGGVVREDPRTRDMQNVRPDLIIRKDHYDAPWRKSLRRKKSGTDLGDEEPRTCEPGPPDIIEICVDDGERRCDSRTKEAACSMLLHRMTTVT